MITHPSYPDVAISETIHLRYQMSSKSNRVPVILLVLAVLGALYCLAGYLMVGSFASAAGEPQPYARAAVLWGVAGAACIVLAVVMAVKLRKRRHPG